MNNLDKISYKVERKILGRTSVETITTDKRKWEEIEFTKKFLQLPSVRRQVQIKGNPVKIFAKKGKRGEWLLIFKGSIVHLAGWTFAESFKILE